MPLPSPTGGWFGIVLFLLIAVTGITLFAIRAGELITLLAKARPEDRTDHIEDRIGQFFQVVLGQSGVLRDPIPGIAHFFTFWGFIIISIGLLNLALQAFGLISANHWRQSRICNAPGCFHHPCRDCFASLRLPTSCNTS